jgi:putative ABC transport system ATP-binding protein
MLTLRDVHKHFIDPGGASIRAADGVSFELSAGELAAIYGPSGSGKTTLLLMMAGFIRPDRGEVLFHDRDLATFSRREIARHRMDEVGFVFQAVRLAPGLTAADNAALKLMRLMGRREARARIAPLLERVGLGGRESQPVAQLSMGERQRVAIARALSNQPRLVLADEPTASLDLRRGHETMSLLAELCRERGVGVVLVTHDFQAARVADRIHVLRDGRLADEAPDSLEAALYAP